MFRLNSAAFVVPTPGASASKLALDGLQLDAYNYYDTDSRAYGSDVNTGDVVRTVRYVAESGSELAYSGSNNNCVTCMILPIVNSLDDYYCQDSSGYSGNVNLLEFYQSWTNGTLGTDFDPILEELGLVSSSVKVQEYDGELYLASF